MIAHRGRCSLTGPENTLAGAMAALDAGCDGVEIDLRRTKDGHLVLMHDPTSLFHFEEHDIYQLPRRPSDARGTHP